MKKRKILLTVSILGLLNLASCAKEPEVPENTYTVIWQDDNGTVLEIDRNVQEGSMPKFDASFPTKESTIKNTYAFAGWSPEIKEVYENITYTATYSESLNKSIVIWKNEDGTVLETDTNVVYGTFPTYDGETPSKQGNDSISYEFNGWSSELDFVTGNVTYTATYSSTKTAFTIVWKNEDGTVLETDTNVAYGTFPSYDGEIPSKQGNAFTTYEFSGWSNELDFVTGNATYTAVFKALSNSEEIEGTQPELSNDGKTVLYGLYPQTHIKDTTLISTLNALEPTDINGWYFYEGEYYTKETAKVFNNESYKFDDGVSVVEGTEYWYRCDKIEWDVISNSNGTYTLLSSILLDTHNYHNSFETKIIDANTIYCNNYKESNIRDWLNDEFYNTAFKLNSSCINQMNVDNRSSTTDDSSNKYACENTQDNVYLLSYQDYLNASYGFLNQNDVSNTRTCKASDYVRASGAWCNASTYNSTYWTRSPSSEYYYAAWNVNSGGYLSTYAIDGSNHCIRPCITISL